MPILTEHGLIDPTKVIDKEWTCKDKKCIGKEEKHYFKWRKKLLNRENFTEDDIEYQDDQKRIYLKNNVCMRVWITQMKNKGLYCRYSVYYYEEKGHQVDAVLGSETYEEDMKRLKRNINID